ncbi:MAG: aminotransferase class III-fold pyridoxal phosphate-dependent enzyme, partial [Flavobacteriales bacterium]
FTSLDDSIFIWVLGFVSGTFYAEAPPSRKLRESMGKFIGKSLNTLSKMDSNLVKSHEHRWDLGNTHLSQEYLEKIENPYYRKFALYYFEEFKSRILPVQHKLPRQVIHGDLNDWNVLCEGDEVSAAIDIGDTCYSARINELAIALVYVMFNQDDVLQAAIETVQSAHAECAFYRKEIELLFLLVGSRMAVSMANAAHSQRLNPENDYISVSQNGVEELVVKWTSLGEIHVSNKLLEACGFEVEQVAVEQLVHAREKVIPKAMRLQFSSPVAMKRALFQYMYDVNGQQYLDAYNNIPHVGHQHPYVVAKAKEQLSTLNTNTRYPHELLNSYAERVLNYLPDGLEQYFPVNSGSAASDLCVRLASNASENHAIYCLQHGYHGNTSIGIAISNYKHDGKGGSGTPSGVEVLMLPEDPSDGDHVDAAIAKAKE